MRGRVSQLFSAWLLEHPSRARALLAKDERKLLRRPQSLLVVPEGRAGFVLIQRTEHVLVEEAVLASDLGGLLRAALQCGCGGGCWRQSFGACLVDRPRAGVIRAGVPVLRFEWCGGRDSASPSAIGDQRSAGRHAPSRPTSQIATILFFARRSVDAKSGGFGGSRWS